MPSPRPLLERRLLIVTGKGGTGKTTVAAAIACAAAREGRRVLVVETGRDDQVPPLLGDLDASDRPEQLRIDPFDALAEYLGLQLGVAAVARKLLSNPGFQQLLDAAPGWRELITLGKIWHMEQARLGGGDDGPPEWDLIVVDAPATGHGLTFLDVPRVAQSAVRAGPLRRHAGWVEALVKDPERTLLLPVALGEELPVRETLELVRRVRGDLDVPIDRVVLNAVQSDPCPDLPDLAERLDQLASASDGAVHGSAALAHAVAHQRTRAAMHVEAEHALHDATALPIARLPFAPDSVRDPSALADWIEPLLGASP